VNFSELPAILLFCFRNIFVTITFIADFHHGPWHDWNISMPTGTSCEVQLFETPPKAAFYQSIHCILQALGLDLERSCLSSLKKAGQASYFTSF
jgi:hypothetical protein